jgi:dienelactone hydrolase
MTRKLTILLIVALSVAACSNSHAITSTPTPVANTPTPEPTPTAIATPTTAVSVQVETVSLTTDDNIKLSANLFVGGQDLAVVLVHMGIGDQTNWKPFARTLAQQGFTALTFDLRCFGQSECGKLGSAEYLHTKDVLAAIEFLRGRGFDRIVCMGASMGGTACMNAAFEQKLVGLVVIASPAPTNINKQYPTDLVNPAMPKLFIVADKDRYVQVVSATSFLYQQSPEPKEFKTFPSTVHGTELFDTKYGDEFRNLLVNFVKGLAEKSP